MRKPRLPFGKAITNARNPRYMKPELPYNFDKLSAKERYLLAYRMYRAGNTEINTLYDCYIKGVIAHSAIDPFVMAAIHAVEQRCMSDMRINYVHKRLLDPAYRKSHTIDSWLIRFNMGLPTYSPANWFLMPGH